MDELDFETNPTFGLTIQVSDSELSAEATITIDLIDVDESVNQPPQINDQTFSIDEKVSCIIFYRINRKIKLFYS